MKIVHVCLAAFYIDNYSYQENILPKMHKKQGHDVLILASTETYVDGVNLGYIKASKYLNEDEIPVHRINYTHYLPSKIVRKLRIYPDVYSELEAFKPDFIFLHDIQFISIRQVKKYVKDNHNVRMIADGHADYINSAKNFISKNILHKIIYRYCAQLILPYTSKFYGTLPARVIFFEKMYKIPSDKVDFMPMGVDDDLLEAVLKENTVIKNRKAFDVEEKDFLIVTGGKFDTGKRQVLTLMDCINAISDSKVKLLVFGSVAKELDSEFKNRLSSNVIYAGWADVEKSYEYISLADLVVFPSTHSVYWEQAAGQGKPLMVRHWEGITHVDLGGNVMFLYSDSAEEMLDKINMILYDKDKYCNMKRIAQEKGRDFFSYRSIAKRMIED